VFCWVILNNYPVGKESSIQNKTMLKRLTGEFLGTFALVFCGTGAIVINLESGGAITHVGIAIVFGLIVMAMILSLGHVSGAHINPAVTIALSIANKFKRQNIIPYIAAQLAGACFASFILKNLFPANEFLGATLPKGSDMQSFILEFILTFLLMLVILTSTDKKDHSVLVPALAIGSTVGLEALFAGPICGASMNPARSIGPALIGGHYQSLWVYVFAPVTGAIAAVLAFVMLKQDYRSD
jgi:aquaporin NIP